VIPSSFYYIPVGWSLVWGYKFIYEHEIWAWIGEIVHKLKKILQRQRCTICVVGLCIRAKSYYSGLFCHLVCLSSIAGFYFILIFKAIIDVLCRWKPQYNEVIFQNYYKQKLLNIKKFKSWVVQINRLVPASCVVIQRKGWFFIVQHIVPSTYKEVWTLNSPYWPFSELVSILLCYRDFEIPT